MPGLAIASETPTFQNVPQITPLPLRPVTLLGIPYDGGASGLRGAADAPDAIREMLVDPSGNTWCLDGFDITTQLDDRGNLAIHSRLGGWSAITTIYEQLGPYLSRSGSPLVVLGGDHSISLPMLRAVRPLHPTLQLLHLDAHPDCYPEFNGDRFSHACPMARIAEEGLADQIVQIGIRSMTEPQRAVAHLHGIASFAPDDWEAGLAALAPGPVYLSLDMDVIDPGVAPAVAHPEPGGLTVREVLTILGRLRGRLIVADLVEYIPSLDHDGMTARVAVRCLKEIVAMLAQPPESHSPLSS